MMDHLSYPNKDAVWWGFMRKETWLHLKRAFEVWWHVIRGKE